MAPRDRCVYSGCSRLSFKEAKASKNYIHGLELSAYIDYVSIEIIYNAYDYNDDKEDGFQLIFRKEHNSSRKIMRCRSLECRELWRIELDDSVDLVQFGTTHFKNLLQFYQSKIRNLQISGDVFDNYDFGVVNLKNLEVFMISADLDISQFFSKIRNPLKILNIYGTNTKTDFANCEQIYQVRDSIHINGFNLSNEQFLQISAKRVFMKIGELTEQDIFNFIKSWKNGKYTGGIERCEWDLRLSNFDESLLCRLLEKDEFRINNDFLQIEQRETCEIARMRFYGSFVKFKLFNGFEVDSDSDTEEEDSDSDFDYFLRF